MAMKPSFIYGLLMFALMIGACQTSAPDSIRPIVKDYYTTYQQRSDFDRFLSFYDEQMVLEDIMQGVRKNGKKEFAAFFNWDDPNFSKTDSAALIITNQVIEGRQAVTEGYFTPFIWGEAEFSAMHFMTLLEFNKAGKIIRQVDWINYPGNLLNYSTRKDANQWIPKGESKVIPAH